MFPVKRDRQLLIFSRPKNNVHQKKNNVPPKKIIATFLVIEAEKMHIFMSVHNFFLGNVQFVTFSPRKKKKNVRTKKNVHIFRFKMTGMCTFLILSSEKSGQDSQSARTVQEQDRRSTKPVQEQDNVGHKCSANSMAYIIFRFR